MISPALSLILVFTGASVTQKPTPAHRQLIQLLSSGRQSDWIKACGSTVTIQVKFLQLESSKSESPATAAGIQVDDMRHFKVDEYVLNIEKSTEAEAKARTTLASIIRESLVDYPFGLGVAPYFKGKPNGPLSLSGKTASNAHYDIVLDSNAKNPKAVMIVITAR